MLSLNFYIRIQSQVNKELMQLVMVLVEVTWCWLFLRLDLGGWFACDGNSKDSCLFIYETVSVIRLVCKQSGKPWSMENSNDGKWKWWLEIHSILFWLAIHLNILSEWNFTLLFFFFKLGIQCWKNVVDTVVLLQLKSISEISAGNDLGPQRQENSIPINVIFTFKNTSIA